MTSERWQKIEQFHYAAPGRECGGSIDLAWRKALICA
jgi:hypothetical protein